LDSPSGVGFSFSDDERDYVTGDLQTEADSHTFLLKVKSTTSSCSFAEEFAPRFLWRNDILGRTTLLCSFLCVPCALVKDKRTETVGHLSQWFAEYPEYQANPFFITGESYAGIYVPTLSRSVANGEL
jgi:carboxypeptidase C (cathepsin A)